MRPKHIKTKLYINAQGRYMHMDVSDSPNRLCWGENARLGQFLFFEYLRFRALNLVKKEKNTSNQLR